MHRPALVAALAACASQPAAPPPIRFLHTFDSKETELFNATMAERRLAVESSLVPFARGQQVIAEILNDGKHCPDAIRIDATWLPELVAAHLLAPPPPALVALDWTPEAAALAQVDGRWWSVPETVDGLFVARDAAQAAPASPSIDDLVAAAKARSSLAVRVDGYWLVPWLRAEGVELQPGDAIASQGAVHALSKFAALFGGVVPAPPAAGSEAPEELRRWNDGEVAYWVTGPWQLGALRDRERVAVSALAHAPRGGQLLVVPTCAPRPEAGWRLAGELTSVTVELVFADAFSTVPTRRAAFDSAAPLVRAEYDALGSAEPLPRSPVTPLLFDDLNPALAAVVAGDATAEEAAAGIARGWHRLRTRP
ncbi:MAG TPA: extracellular solute-binding protein [Kofleriaceae bacterium]|nr:extracellular solute-binding protein [Kofleriaceae bacterium]